MSGIAGIYYLDGRPVSEETLSIVYQSIAHRGPDAQRMYTAGNLGFVQVMLQTTPESINEILPYEDPDSRLLITADARLDNRDDLGEALGLRSVDLPRIPDSRIILEAYKKWGTSCAAYLIGDFAFAIHDQRERSLFCARDHMGIRPFYYYHDDRCFLFGSEIKAILSAREFIPRINEQRIFDYLVFYHSDHETTFYEKIKRLPARSCLKLTPDAFAVNHYWDFSPEQEIRLSSDDEYAEAFREQFSRAVSCRLPSAYPIGAFLSGGLDSSSIVCVAQGQLKAQGRGPLHTFSEIFPDLPESVFHRSDERKYMDAVIKQCRPKAQFVPITDQNPLQGLDLPHYDEPMPYFNGYLLDQTCQAARDLGVRVLLDGSDGDTTVSHGYERFYHLGTHFRFPTLLREARLYCQRHQIPFSSPRLLRHYCLQPYVPDVLLRAVKSLRGKEAESSLPILAALTAEFKSRYDWRQRREQIARQPSFRRCGRLPQYYLFRSPLQQYTMEFIDSRIAANHQEIRYPFWDRRLMEFCLALPLAQKMSNGWGRAILRNAMHTILPLEVERRIGKADLSPYFLLSFAERGQAKISPILSPTSAVAAYVKVGQIEKWWRQFIENPLKEPELALALYLVASLNEWVTAHNRLG